MGHIRPIDQEFDIPDFDISSITVLFSKNLQLQMKLNILWKASEMF